jgi:hypothetical protein
MGRLPKALKIGRDRRIGRWRATHNAPLPYTRIALRWLGSGLMRPIILQCRRR